MEAIYALHNWTKPQRNWLDRLATQLKFETVIDGEFVNRTFARNGGSKGLDKILGGQLDSVMSTLVMELWPETG